MKKTSIIHTNDLNEFISWIKHDDYVIPLGLLLKETSDTINVLLVKQDFDCYNKKLSVNVIKDIITKIDIKYIKNKLNWLYQLDIDIKTNDQCYYTDFLFGFKNNVALYLNVTNKKLYVTDNLNGEISYINKSFKQYRDHNVIDTLIDYDNTYYVINKKMKNKIKNGFISYLQKETK